MRACTKMHENARSANFVSTAPGESGRDGAPQNVVGSMTWRSFDQSTIESTVKTLPEPARCFRRREDLRSGSAGLFKCRRWGSLHRQPYCDAISARVDFFLPSAVRRDNVRGSATGADGADVLCGLSRRGKARARVESWIDRRRAD